MNRAPQDDTSPERNVIDSLLGKALEGMCVGLAIMSPGGRIKWMNRAAERIFGTDRSSSIGQPLGQILKDPQLMGFWHEASGTDDTLMAEISIRWPQEHDLKINATTCLDAKGHMLARAVLFCDVTQDRSARVELSRQVSQALLDLAGQKKSDREAHCGMTANELRVLGLVGQGLGNSEVASQMGIAISTVRTHLKNIYKKTGLHTRPEIVKYAISNGIE